MGGHTHKWYVKVATLVVTCPSIPIEVFCGKTVRACKQCQRLRCRRHWSSWGAGASVHLTSLQVWNRQRVTRNSTKCVYSWGKKDDLINLMLHFMCVFCFFYVAVQIQKDGVTTRSLSIFKIYGILFHAFYTMSLLLFYGRTRCGKKTIQMAIVRFPGLNIKE